MDDLILSCPWCGSQSYETDSTYEFETPMQIGRSDICQCNSCGKDFYITWKLLRISKKPKD